MSALPTGVSYRILQDIVDEVERGNTLFNAFAMAEVCSDMEQIISNKTAYWFLFDNLNRDAAQELWVRAWKLNQDRLENSRELL